MFEKDRILFIGPMSFPLWSLEQFDYKITGNEAVFTNGYPSQVTKQSIKAK